MSDIEGLRELTTDLGRIASRALPDVDVVAKHAAQNIKDEMVEDAQGSRAFRSIARSISYDRSYSVGQVAYEVGPDKSRGGQLGNIAYFGGANGGGGTLDIDGPLKAEEPRFLKALDEMLGDL
jgi:hypothetical protein